MLSDEKAPEEIKKENLKKDQWDGGNIWPPLVQLTIEYLIRSKNIELARQVSVSYLNHMNRYYATHNSLPEKIE